MKRIKRSILILTLSIAVFATQINFAFAQDVAPAQESEVPTAIVIQSVGSQSGAIEWVILFLIVALLVLVTIAVSGTLQDQFRVRWQKPDQNENNKKKV